MTTSAPIFMPAQPQTVAEPKGLQHLSDLELEVHIFDCERLWRTAYDRFIAYRLPADRDEAMLWLHEQNQAILNRSRALQAHRHAEFERSLDCGLDYFQSQDAIDLGRLGVAP